METLAHDALSVSQVSGSALLENAEVSTPTWPSEKPPAAPARRPHIAFLGSQGIPARHGGFETFVEEVSVRLVDLGIDVTVFCEGRALSGPSSFQGVQLEYVHAWAPGPLRTLQFDAQCLLRSCRRFDVVYMLGYGSSAMCFLPRCFGREVWINMDGIEWRRSKWGRVARAWLWTMERAALTVASRVVFDNAGLRAEVEGRRGLHAPAVVIEYGAAVVECDEGISSLARFGLESGEYYLVVCRLEPENHVIEIMRAHRRSGVRRPLAVVANAQIAGKYARTARSLAGEGVRLLGPVYDSAVLRPLRRHAFAYVHGHSVGGTNPSLIEAMGCGNFVIAHDNPFNRETLDGAARFWSSEEELVLRLRESESTDTATRQDLGHRGRERVREHYTWDRIARMYADLVRESCA